MKILRLIAFALTLTGFASCQMLEGEDNDSQSYGSLQLSVEKKLPSATRAKSIDTQDFKVTISNNGGYSANYVVKDMPEAIRLTPGDYSVKASSAETFAKKMATPYFLGTADMTIKEGLTTQTTVDCTQQNSRIKLNYGKTFTETFDSWTITIDDGSSSVLLFDEKEETMNPVYWQFGEDVKTLSVNLTAYPADGGNKVTGSLTITKADAEERYDDDNEDYAGGDAITLNFNMGAEDEPESTVGEAGISVSVNAKFSNQDEEVKIPVVWDDDNKGDNDDSEGISIDFSQNDVTYSIAAQNAPTPLDAVISANDGIKSVKVKIETTCASFNAAVADLTESDIYLTTGHELVGDVMLPFVFSSLGLGDVSMPAEGDKTYTFPIATFYPFIEMYMTEDDSADFNFHITVKDSNDNVKESTLKLTITK